jgi:hypothetical protein
MPDGAALSLRAGTGAQNQQPDDYIQFYPTGRCDVATLTLTAGNGETFLVACDSPAEPFRVLTGQEAANR